MLQLLYHSNQWRQILLILASISFLFISNAYADTTVSNPNDSSIDTANTETATLSNLFKQEGFSFGGYQDSVLGFMGEMKVSSYLRGNNHAAALELNGGPRIFRINATYGFNLTDKQRVKFTGERLDEKLDFDFNNPLDAETVSRWVGQNAGGVDYAYLLDSISSLESIGFGGYYTHSAGKEISSGTIYDAANNLDYFGQQRIAGANSGNVHADFAVRPWSYSRLSGGVDYDTVRFETQNTGDQNRSGFGGHAALEQRLFPTVKWTIDSDFRQTERGYGVGIGWLTPSVQGLQTEIEAATNFTKDLTSNRHYYTTGLRFNMVFDEAVGGSRQAVYSDLNPGAQPSLLDWTRTPAVRMSTVLAAADGSTLPGFISCPAAIRDEGKGHYTAPGGWSNKNNPSSYSGTAAFAYALIDTSDKYSGQCVYYITVPTHTVTLTNPNTGEKTGNNWIHNIGTQYQCDKDLNPSLCQFVDLRVFNS